MTVRPTSLARPSCLFAAIVLVWCLGLMWAPDASAQVPGGLPGSDVTGSVGDTVGDAVDDATGTVGDTVDGVTDAVDGALDPVDDAVDGPVGDAVGAVDGTVEEVTGIVDETVDGVTETVDGVVDETVGTVDEVTDAVDDATGGATNPVTEVVDDTVEEVTGGAGGVLPGLGGTRPGAAGRSLGGGSRSGSVTAETGGGILQPGTSDTTAPAETSRRQEPAGRAASTAARRASSPQLTPLDAFARALSPASSAVLEAAQAAERNEARPGIFSRVGEAAADVARRVAFPLALLLIVGGFLALQNRLDRNDPKLALAPVDQSQEVLYFE